MSTKAFPAIERVIEMTDGHIGIVWTSNARDELENARRLLTAVQLSTNWIDDEVAMAVDACRGRVSPQAMEKK